MGEQLKKKLNAWNKKTEKDRKARGGADSDAWALAHKQDEDNKALEDNKILVENQKKNIAYTSDELFYRILRVERMADKVKDFASAKDQLKILSEIKDINAQ